MRVLWIRSTFKLLTFFLTLVLAGVAHADWYKDYEDALDLLKKNRFSEAIPLLTAAIGEKNREGVNIKFYGMKFDDYFPHYYLGKSFFSTGNYQAALKAFENSESQGEILRKRDLYKTLNELKSLSIAQINLKSPPVEPVAEKKQPPVPQPVTQPSPAPAQETEKKELTELKRQEQPSMPANMPASTTDPKAIEPVQPTPSDVTDQTRLRLLAKDGAKKYFQGDFDGAIIVFEQALQITPDYPSAKFLMGCSYAGLYLLNGSSDPDLFRKAVDAFQQIRKTNPDHPLIQSSFISPAVREIYDRSGRL